MVVDLRQNFCCVTAAKLPQNARKQLHIVRFGTLLHDFSDDANIRAYASRRRTVTHHLVVVDDRSATARRVSTIVAQIEDIVVHPFSTSAEAIGWAVQNPADAFVLGCGATADEILQTVRSLRRDTRFALLPAIVVSTGFDADARLAVLEAGADDVIAQPVEARELVARLRMLLNLCDARTHGLKRIALLEQWLQQDQLRLRRYSERFSAMWAIANNADPLPTAVRQDILDRSTAALRSGQFFTGGLSRFDNDAVIFEARSFDPDEYRETSRTPLGTRVPLAESIQQISLASGRTHAWDDVTTDPVAATIPRVREIGCRALITTPFTVRGTKFCLTWWSRERVEESFGNDDETYVELIANLMAARLAQSRAASEQRPPENLAS